MTIIVYFFIRLWSLKNTYMKNSCKQQLQNEFFRRIMNMDKNEFCSVSSAYWASIFSTDIENTSYIFLDFVFTIPAEIIYLIAIFVIIFKYSMLLFTIVLINFILNSIVILLRNEQILPKKVEIQNDYKDIQSMVNEYAKAKLDCKTNKLKTFVIIKFNKIYTDYIRKNKSICKSDCSIDIFVAGLNSLTIAIGLYTCLRLALSSTLISVGLIVILIEYIQILCSKIEATVINIKYLQDFIPYIERLKSIENQSKVIDNISKTKLNTKHIYPSEPFTYISYQNVNLKKDEKIIIKGLNFVISKQEKILIVGKSGAGKTTIVESLIDDSMIETGEKIVLGKNPDFRVLFQKPYIFNRSIKENIVFGNNSIDDGRLYEIISIVKLDRLINENDASVDRTIGDLGFKLSGGEKNKIALARLIINSTDYLIIDEPLIGINQDEKKYILENIRPLLDKKTVVIISHDKDLGYLCDKVMEVNHFV